MLRQVFIVFGFVLVLLGVFGMGVDLFGIYSHDADGILYDIYTLLFVIAGFLGIIAGEHMGE